MTMRRLRMTWAWLLGCALALAVFGCGDARSQHVSQANLMLPHPSGRCRAWNHPGSFDRARSLLSEFIEAAKNRVLLEEVRL